MKHNIDIQVVLATIDDMEDIHSDPDAACEQLNFILHALYDRADDDISVSDMEKILQLAWETWQHDSHLSDLDEDELLDWVDHTLTSWDDAEQL